MKKIFLLRHSNALKHKKLLYTLDKLSPEGKEKVEKFASEFKYNGKKIICSPLHRSIETAKPFSNHNNVPIIIEPCWIEAHRGIFQKRPYNEFLEEWSKFDLSYDYVPQKGESVNQLRKRIVKGLDNVINSNDDEVLCITHGGLISNALMMLYDFEFEQALPTQAEMAVLIQDRNHFILDPKLNSFLKINKKYEVSIKKIYDYQ